MKAQIKIIRIEGMVEESTVPAFHFVEIINIICSSIDRKELQTKMNKFKLSQHYDWGFGGHHMWVARTDTKQRIILVEFEQ